MWNTFSKKEWEGLGEPSIGKIIAYNPNKNSKLIYAEVMDITVKEKCVRAFLRRLSLTKLSKIKK